MRLQATPHSAHSRAQVDDRSIVMRPVKAEFQMSRGQTASLHHSRLPLSNERCSAGAGSGYAGLASLR